MVRNAAAMQVQHARLANAIAIACLPPLTARLHVLPPARRHSRHSASSPATSPLHLLLLESNPLPTPSPNPPLYISPPPPPPIAPLLCPLFFFLLSLTLLILASSSSSIQWICTLPTRGGRRTRRRSGRCRSRRPSRGEPLRRRRQAPRRPRCTASSPGSSGTSCRGSRAPRAAAAKAARGAGAARARAPRRRRGPAVRAMVRLPHAHGRLPRRRPRRPHLNRPPRLPWPKLHSSPAQREKKLV